MAPILPRSRRTEPRSRTLRAWHLAQPFTTPRWSWIYVMLLTGAVMAHVALMACIACQVYGTDDPNTLTASATLIAHQQWMTGLLMLVFLVWLHMIVALWLWILFGITRSSGALPTRAGHEK